MLLVALLVIIIIIVVNKLQKCKHIHKVNIRYSPPQKAPSFFEHNT